MIYRIVRKIDKLALAVFFKKIVVSGADHIPGTGPLILVANHPNTLMDPLIVATLTHRRIGFVANAGLFSNKIIQKIFRYFHVIPIYRKKDVKPGEKPDNEASFAKCYQYLDHGGAFLIFPEGSSYHELRLREIKTGTARIALGFEALHDFERNLKIVPVALDYSDSLQFRSMVAVTINPVISLKQYKELYAKNEIEAVQHLTESIRKSLAEHIPQTSGKEQEDYLIKAHKFYAAYFEPDADLYLNPARSLQLRSRLSEALRFVDTHNRNLYDSIQRNINTFFDKIKSVNLTTGFFTQQFIEKNPVMVCTGYLIILIVLLPFYLFGLAANYIPYILPSKVFEALKTDIEYKSSIQLIVGLFSFPLFYFIEIYLFRTFISTNLFYTITFFVLLPLTGYVAMYFWTETKRFVRVINFYFVLKPGLKNEIISLRDEILKQMVEAARQLK